MSNGADTLPMLIAQLQSGDLAPTSGVMLRYDPSAASLYRMDGRLNERGSAHSKCADTLKGRSKLRGQTDKVAREVAALARKVVEDQVEGLIEDDEAESHMDWAFSSLFNDFKLLTTAILLGVNDDVVSGILVCYKAGRIPTFSLRYPGTYDSVLAMSRAEAQRLLPEAEARAKRLSAVVTTELEADRKRQELAQAELRSELTTSGELPVPIVLEKCFRPNGVFARESTRLVMVPSELGKVKIPEAWRALLAAQSDGQAIPWESVWPASLRRKMNRAWTLISEKCLGVGIAVGRGFPSSLLYIFATPQKSFPGGKFYFAYIGGPPIGDTGPTSDEHRRRLEVLPTGLQEFYRTVHDGWTVLSGAGGPLPLKNLNFLNELVSEEEVFGDLKRPFSLDTTLQIMSTGVGDALCLDTKRSRPQRPVGIFYWHETPEESDLNIDFWKVLNHQIEAGSNKWCSRSQAGEAGPRSRLQHDQIST